MWGGFVKGRTLAECDLTVMQSAPKQGVPSGIKNTVTSTWGQIKALY